MGEIMKAIPKLLKHQNKSYTQYISALSILENDIYV